MYNRWVTVCSVYADVTGVGNYIVEDVPEWHSGKLGVVFAVQSIAVMANILREKIRAGEMKIPFVPARKLGNID